MKALILRMVELISVLYENKGMKEIAGVLVASLDNLGYIFGVNAQLLHGIMGILNGDYLALARMAAPIADIDPEIINKLIHFLEDVRMFLGDFDRRAALRRMNKPGRGRFTEEQWRDIAAKI